MKIGIVGATGFIGGSITKALSTSKNEVSIITRDQLKGNDFPKKLDLVINAVGKGMDSSKQINYREMFSANVRVPEILAEQCSENEIILIQISSAVKDNAFRSDDGYAFTKKTADEILGSFVKYSDLKLLTISPHIVFGPKDHSGLVSRIIKAHKNDEPFILNNPETTRDFIFITDFQSAVESVVNNSVSIKSGTTFEIGYGKSFELRKICEIVGNYTKSKNPWTLGHMNQEGSKDLVADTLLMRDTFGWEPHFTIDEAIGLTVEAN